jgi:hypothetical protein
VTVDFRIDDARVRGEAVVLALHGEVDLHAAPELRERLADDDRRGRFRRPRRSRT